MSRQVWFEGYRLPIVPSCSCLFFPLLFLLWRCCREAHQYPYAYPILCPELGAALVILHLCRRPDEAPRAGLHPSFSNPRWPGAVLLNERHTQHLTGIPHPCSCGFKSRASMRGHPPQGSQLSKSDLQTTLKVPGCSLGRPLGHCGPEQAAVPGGPGGLLF